MKLRILILALLAVRALAAHASDAIPTVYSSKLNESLVAGAYEVRYDEGTDLLQFFAQFRIEYYRKYWVLLGRGSSVSAEGVRLEPQTTGKAPFYKGSLPAQGTLKPEYTFHWQRLDNPAITLSFNLPPSISVTAPEIGAHLNRDQSLSVTFSGGPRTYLESIRVTLTSGTTHLAREVSAGDGVTFKPEELSVFAPGSLDIRVERHQIAREGKGIYISAPVTVDLE